ncbi:hypothetical protein PENSUB_5326 [Penicillium subrubescens]|uniref:Uncharacterized protein n=1 Tax=Penicillium subrubescens TaxID=1316194 RepID=A0A1Q5UA32_9EURO|nr:hypothetical protein PENSUB_9997 [Penicillium subrubescens]OKP09329.1 hypothetical protein PENSUB_5326 [Penicillium subrubescens]
MMWLHLALLHPLDNHASGSFAQTLPSHTQRLRTEAKGGYIYIQVQSWNPTLGLPEGMQPLGNASHMQPTIIGAFEMQALTPA